MAFQIVRNDITRVEADAIVNTANPKPVYASGTDYAVYHAAGADALLAERRKIGDMKPGEVHATKAYGLRARYIIHAVGPVWVDGKHGEFDILASCYRKSLHLAEILGCESIAFPLIATGVYGFPRDRALQTALEVIREFQKDSEMRVILVVFSREAYELSTELTRSVRQYIDDHYCRNASEMEYGTSVPFREREREAAWRRARREAEASEEPLPAPGAFGAEQQEMSLPMASMRVQEQAAPKKKPGLWESVFGEPQKKKKEKSLQDVLDQAGETFQQMLMRKINEKGLTGPEVYKRANLDKKLFSKIRTNPYYVPKKQTAVALAIGLRLNLDETVDLIGRAGLALSPSSKFDLIITYCIEHNNYDVYEINALLFEYEQPLLGF